MSLPGMLSAVRTLLLDLDEIPADLGARVNTYAALFPGLRSEEIQDLAKIQPEKLKIYTSTIFTGEANVLRNHFKLSLALLAKKWERLFGETFSGFTLVRSLHKVRPWKSNTTTALGENFYLYCTQDTPRLAAEIPELESAARLELRTISIRRAPDEAAEAGQGITPQEIRALTVGELLGAFWHIPGFVRFEVFTHDVVRAWRALRREEEIPAVISAGSIFAAGSRNAKKFSRWEYLPERMHRELSVLPREEASTLGALAESFLSDCGEADEQAQFDAFLSFLLPLIDSGIIVVRRS